MTTPVELMNWPPVSGHECVIKNNVGAAHVALVIPTPRTPLPHKSTRKQTVRQTRRSRMATCTNLDIYVHIFSNILTNNFVSNDLAESAADSEIVIRPTAANNINKWEGEDADDDVKVCKPSILLKSKRNLHTVQNVLRFAVWQSKLVFCFLFVFC